MTEVSFQGQPSYVDFAIINDNLTAFLGLKHGSQAPLDKIKACQSKYFHRFRMVVPPKFRLLRVNELRTKVESGDTSAVNINDADLYPGCASQAIILDVCTIITSIDPRRMDPHPGIHLQPCQGDPNAAGDGYCAYPPGTFQGSGGGQGEENTRTVHDPIIFFLRSECLGDDARKRLKEKFSEEELDQANGYFVLPQELPDRGVCYFFLPNVDNYIQKSSGGDSPKDPPGVKPILKNWIDALREYDFDHRDKTLFVAIDDHQLLPVDSWSASVSRISYLTEVNSEGSL